MEEDSSEAEAATCTILDEDTNCTSPSAIYGKYSDMFTT